MDPSSVVELDSAGLRCLAHPLRLRLLSTLRLHGSDTSAGLARRLETNTGQTSYHLRQLAEHGLVREVADRGTARERWWEAAHDVTSWTEGAFLDDPDDRAAADWMLGQIVRTKYGWIQQWLATRHAWSPEWLDAAEHADLRLQLTPAQLTAMKAELEAVVDRYADDGPAEGGDVQPVTILIDLFPHPDPEV